MKFLFVEGKATRPMIGAGLTRIWERPGSCQCAVVLRAWTMPRETFLFGEKNRVTLRTLRSSRRVHAILRTRAPHTFYELDFRARRPVSMRVVVSRQGAGEIESLHMWPMTRGPSKWASTRDPFQAATLWAYAAMYPRRKQKPGRDHFEPDPAAQATMRRLYAAMADLERTAADICVPAMRRLALRFPFHLRFLVYTRLVDDTTGRLAQLVSSCPGALTFAFGLEALRRQYGPGVQTASRRLLSDVVAGRKLDATLDDALEALASGAEEMCATAPVPDPVWLRVVTMADGAGRADLLRRHRLLIRRAGPMVASTNLLLPAPIAFALEDIPRPVRENARWFTVVKCSRLLLTHSNQEDPERRLRFCAFVSKNAAALATVRGFDMMKSAIGAFHDYVIATNRWPGPRTNPQRFIEEAHAWHERMTRVDVNTVVCNGVLPPPPVESWSVGNVEVNPVTTVKALIEEGRSMRNCVLARLSSVREGASYIFHASIDGSAVTVEIRPNREGWKIVEAKAFANKEITREQRAALRKWEEELVSERVPGMEG